MIGDAFVDMDFSFAFNDAPANVPSAASVMDSAPIPQSQLLMPERAFADASASGAVEKSPWSHTGSISLCSTSQTNATTLSVKRCELVPDACLSTPQLPDLSDHPPFPCMNPRDEYSTEAAYSVNDPHQRSYDSLYDSSASYWIGGLNESALSLVSADQRRASDEPQLQPVVRYHAGGKPASGSM